MKSENITPQKRCQLYRRQGEYILISEIEQNGYKCARPSDGLSLPTLINPHCKVRLYGNRPKLSWKNHESRCGSVFPTYFEFGLPDFVKNDYVRSSGTVGLLYFTDS